MGICAKIYLFLLRSALESHIRKVGDMRNALCIEEYKTHLAKRVVQNGNMNQLQTVHVGMNRGL